MTSQSPPIRKPGDLIDWAAAEPHTCEVCGSIGRLFCLAAVVNGPLGRPTAALVTIDDELHIYDCHAGFPLCACRHVVCPEHVPKIRAGKINLHAGGPLPAEIRGCDARMEDSANLFLLARAGRGWKRFRMYGFVVGAALVGVATALAVLIFWH
jgi:hypothetical protein